jgi:hypothetical protein
LLNELRVSLEPVLSIEVVELGCCNLSSFRTHQCWSWSSLSGWTCEIVVYGDRHHTPHCTCW